MQKRNLFFLLLVGSLMQVRCEFEEHETEDFEGSGGTPLPLMPHDDEDLDDEMDGSGSGYVDDDLRKIKTTADQVDITLDQPEVTPVENESIEGKPSKGNDDVIVSPTAPTPTAVFLKSSQFVAALIVGGCAGLLFAICVIMLLAYRMRKKDEGSYALDEQKKPVSSSAYQYTQGQEYYA